MTASRAGTQTGRRMPFCPFRHDREWTQRMKKTLKWTFIAAIFAVAVLFCSAALAEIASGTDGSITWSLSYDGLLTISGNGPMNDYVNGGSPWYGYRVAVNLVIIEENVTRIGKNAFRECSSLESITIPDSVTSIGVSAFRGCSSLESITIPNSVTSIGSSAFQGCSSLESITIPNSVTSIGDEAFKSCIPVLIRRCRSSSESSMFPSPSPAAGTVRSPSLTAKTSRMYCRA